MKRKTSSASLKNSAGALAHVTVEITRLLEQGVMPWRAPWDAKLALAATPGLPLRSTGEPYRGANVVLLWAAQIARNYSKRTWLTYRQCLALGGHVRRGEKACTVVYYGQAKANDDNQTAKGEEAARDYRFLKLFYVFNLDQCEDLPDHLSNEPDISLVTPNEIQTWLERAGARIRIGGDKAFYAPSVDAIHMPHSSAFLSAEHWSATLAHEGVHFTGAASRLDRLKDYATEAKARAREELIAELGAAMIGAMTGHAPHHIEDHASYIETWLRLVRDEPRAFLSAGAKAQAAVDWLIEHAGHPSGQNLAAGTDNDPSLSTQRSAGGIHAAL